MLRDIVERETARPRAPTAPSLPSDPSSSSSGGFPAIVHRSQRTSKRPSAFANRNAQSGLHIGRGVDSVPTVQAGSSQTLATVKLTPASGGGEDLTGVSEAERVQRQVDAENAARVEGMSKEEREQEVGELKERFGPGLVDIMRRRREKRLAGQKASTSVGGPASDEARSDAGHSGAPPMTEAQRVYKQVDEENQQRVEAMTSEEREHEIKELEERFGKGVMDMRNKRATGKAGKQMNPAASIEGEDRTGLKDSSTPTGSSGSMVPPSSRSVRFDEASKTTSTTDAPTAPTAASNGSDLLSRYFPNEQPESAKLAWTQDIPNPSHSSSDNPIAAGQASMSRPESSSSNLRFDLSGRLLSAAQQEAIPVSHGLHHHGDQPDMAGYTLEEMMLLARSTVVMQRVSMMRLLSRVMEVYIFDATLDAPEDGSTIGYLEQESVTSTASDRQAVLAEIARLDVPRKMAPVAIEIIFSRRNVTLLGAAISLLYTSLGGPGWTWLDTPSSLTTLPFRPHAVPIGPVTLPELSVVPFVDLLPVMSDLLGDSTYLEPASTEQMILILRRATVHSAELAGTVLGLGPHILRAHTTSRTWPPLPPMSRRGQDSRGNSSGRAADEMPLSSPIALIADLVSASRRCAVELHNARIADGLLRFLVISTWPSPSSSAGAEDGARKIEADDQSPQPSPTILSQRAESAELATQTLKLLTAFGRYGLGAALATGALDLWRDLYNDVHRVMTKPRPNHVDESDDIIFAPLIVAYFELIAVWTTCAIDPHRTTPEHDLTWSQMDNFGWADQAVSVTTLASERLNSHGREGGDRNGEDTDQLYILSAALGALVAWLDGVKVNGVKQGQAEKEAVLAKLKGVGLGDIFERVKNGEMAVQQDVLLRLVQVHARLSLTNNTATTQAKDHILSAEQVEAISLQYTSPVPKGPLVQTYTASAIAYELLSLSRRSIIGPESSATTQALSHMLTAVPLLQTFAQGAEPLALQLLDDILHTNLSALPADLRDTTRIEQIGHKDALLILRPLLQHAILADDKHVTAPTRADSAYLKATTSLRAAAPFDPVAERKRKMVSVLDDEDDRKPTSNGLPLSPDWLFHPIGELLRSQDSVALQQAPADWSASEIELVRATLSLVTLSIEISSATTGSTSTTKRSEADVLVKEDDDGFVQAAPADVAPNQEVISLDSANGPVKVMSRSQIFWGIMRVYMLEHQPAAGPTDGEVFRDDIVAALIGRLMGYLASVPPAEIHPSALATLSSASPSAPATSAIATAASTPTSSSAPLEIASTAYLFPEPFLTFYQDLVGLFENSSFGDPLFARVILPPLAFGYNAEYRKLIWGNTNVLRLIRTTVADAPIEDDSVHAGVRAYWCQVHADGRVSTEDDPEVLAAYGQALVKGWLRSELLEGIALRGLIAFFFAPSADSDATQQTEQGGKAGAGGGESKGEKQGALEKLRKGLMGAVLSGAPAEIVGKLIKRNGTHDAAVDAEASAEEVERRLKVVRGMCGDRAVARATHIATA